MHAMGSTKDGQTGFKQHGPKVPKDECEGEDGQAEKVAVDAYMRGVTKTRGRRHLIEDAMSCHLREREVKNTPVMRDDARVWRG